MNAQQHIELLKQLEAINSNQSAESKSDITAEQQLIKEGGKVNESRAKEETNQATK